MSGVHPKATQDEHGDLGGLVRTCSVHILLGKGGSFPSQGHGLAQGVGRRENSLFLL